LCRLEHPPVWNVLVASAIVLCRDQNANNAGMSAALRILGKVGAADQTVQDQTNSVVAGGQLASRLNEAYAQQLDLVLARTFALLLIGKNYNFPMPENGNWEPRIAQSPDLLRSMDEALVEFEGRINTGRLFEAAKANPALLVILRNIIGLRIQAKKLGPLFIGQIVADLPQYLLCIDNALHDSFMVQISEYKNFWSELGKRPLDASTLTLFRALIKDPDETGQKAKVALAERLNTLDAETWTNAIRAGSEPLLIAADLAKIRNSLEVGPNLYDGLQSLIGDVLTTADDDFRDRWFNATSYLSRDSRQTVLSNLRDGILSTLSTAQLPALLSLGSGAIIESGGFSDKADDCVRHIVIPLLDIPDGLKWILQNVSVVTTWVDGAKASTKGFLRERLGGLLIDESHNQRDNLRSLFDTWFPDQHSRDISKLNHEVDD
jgi:hypothetical protein